MTCYCLLRTTALVPWLQNGYSLTIQWWLCATLQKYRQTGKRREYTVIPFMYNSRKYKLIHRAREQLRGYLGNERAAQSEKQRFQGDERDFGGQWMCSLFDCDDCTGFTYVKTSDFTKYVHFIVCWLLLNRAVYKNMGRNESVAGRPCNYRFYFSNLYKTSTNMLDIRNNIHPDFMGIMLKRRGLPKKESSE